MARSPRVSFHPGNTTRFSSVRVCQNKGFKQFSCRFNKSLEWDFSDADSVHSVLSEELAEISDRKRKESKVEVTLSQGRVWDEGATLDGRTLEKFYARFDNNCLS